MSVTRLLENSRRSLWIVLGIYFLTHLYLITAPPNGYHQWRESDTAAIALNYYQEDMNFLQPRVNQRGATSGITGSELPIYNYTVALAYHVTGPSHAAARLLTLIAALVGLWLFSKIVTNLSSERVSRFAVWALAFSPLYFFYGNKIMPDMWMLTLLLGTVWLFLKHLKSGSVLALAMSALLLMLSACLKPLCLSIYLPFLYLVWRQKEGRLVRLAWFSSYVAITFMSAWGWFTYARHVNEIHGSGVFYFGQLSVESWNALLTTQFYKKLFLQWPFELWIGWTMTPFFLYGIYRTIKFGGGAIYFLWLLSAYLVFALISYHSSSHDYYTLIIVPPLAALTGIGFERLYQRISWKNYLIFFLLLAVPATTVLRLRHRWDNPADFDKIRSDAERIIPRGSLVMIQDGSTAIRLYQLNRTGWPLRFGVNYSEVADLVAQGGRYLVVEKPIEEYGDSLVHLFQNTSDRVGDWYCYTVRK